MLPHNSSSRRSRISTNYAALPAVPFDARASFESELEVIKANVCQIYCRCLKVKRRMLQGVKESKRHLAKQRSNSIETNLRDSEEKFRVRNQKESVISWALVIGVVALTARIVARLPLAKQRSNWIEGSPLVCLIN